LQAMQIYSARPSSVRAADPVADLAREFHCPGVAGHPVGFQKSACGRDLR
jgi:hypothetical protein